MKTSFYFVVWMLIYPILSLFGSQTINDNSFIVAIVVVFAMSWFINRAMPRTLVYETALEYAPILEDIFTGNIKSFKSRLTRTILLEGTGACYFLVTVLFLLLAKGAHNGFNGWFSVVIFGYFGVASVARMVKFIHARVRLQSEPTPEECMNIADELYGADYAAYYYERIETTYEGVLPPRPAHYTVFRVVSLIFAVLSFLLGLANLVVGVVLYIVCEEAEALSGASMLFLYGFLASYFGLRDFISIVSSRRRKSSISSEMLTQQVN